MKPRRKTTQERAIDALWGNDHEKGLLNEVMALLHGDPTTEELHEARKAVKAVEHTIDLWICSRNICNAAPRTITRDEIDAAIRRTA